jgi:hypothetical protein
MQRLAFITLVVGFDLRMQEYTDRYQLADTTKHAET